MFTSIVALIASLPAFFSMLVSVWKMISDEITLLEKRQLVKDFASATKTAVASGNTSALEGILKSGNQ